MSAELLAELRQTIADHQGDLRDAVVKYGLPPECEARMPAAIEAFVLMLLDEPLPWVDELAADLKRLKEMRESRDALGIEDAPDAFAWCIASLRSRSRGAR
jgi:hypothetical protein